MGQSRGENLAEKRIGVEQAVGTSNFKHTVCGEEALLDPFKDAHGSS